MTCSTTDFDCSRPIEDGCKCSNNEGPSDDLGSYYNCLVKTDDKGIPVSLLDVTNALSEGAGLDAYINIVRFNAMKYLWRFGRKRGSPVEIDIKKAIKYLQLGLRHIHGLKDAGNMAATEVWQEKQYTDLLQKILIDGDLRRVNGEEGRYELFSPPSLEFDLRCGKIPLFTTKKVQWRTAFIEMLWFLQGTQDIAYLKEHNVKIWNSWADENGVVGALYGSLMRDWRIHDEVKKYHEWNKSVDQLATVMRSLRDRPEARSHVITMWRPDYLPVQSIKPCHVYLQFYRYKDEISLHLTQRSCDAFLGVPFNIAQYSMLCHLVAHHLGCTARKFTWHGCDVHIYENHIDQVGRQLKNPILGIPTIQFTRRLDGLELKNYTIDDIIIDGYKHAEFIPAPLSIQGNPGTGKTV